MKMLMNFSYFTRAALSATISVLVALSFVLHTPTTRPSWCTNHLERARAIRADDYLVQDAA